MAGNTDVNVKATGGRSLMNVPKQADQQILPVRVGAYGDAIIPFGPERQAAEEGSLFVFSNPTPGTGIQFAAIAESQAYATATKASILAIFNANKPGGKRIYMKSFKLFATVVPTGCISMEFAHKLQSSTRNPLSNVTAITPVQVNNDDAAKSNAIINVPLTSAITHAADGTDMVLVGRTRIPTGVAVIGDEYVVSYGADDEAPGAGALTAARATAPAKFVANAPAVVIAPQTWYVLNWWWLTASTAAAAFEFEGKYVER